MIQDDEVLTRSKAKNCSVQTCSPHASSVAHGLSASLEHHVRPWLIDSQQVLDMPVVNKEFSSCAFLGRATVSCGSKCGGKAGRELETHERSDCCFASAISAAALNA